MADSRQPTAGVSIAIYDNGHSVIDDRRWVDSDGKQLVLEHVDPGAALASLVIEPLAGPPIQIGGCERDRIPHADDKNDALGKAQRDARRAHKTGHAAAPAHDMFVPVVRCAVTAAPGRYLVRVLYVSGELGYQAEHELAMTTPTRARLTSHYAVATPPWGVHADVTLFEGAPGGEHPPVEVGRGHVTLDGATAVIAVPPREVPAALRRVLRADNADSLGLAQPVWLWLDLPGARMPSGMLRVHVALPGEDLVEQDLPPAAAPPEDGELHFRLAVDTTLKGTRQRTSDYAEGAELAERFVMSVANTGAAAREVWIEETLRPSRRHTIERSLPAKLTAKHGVVSTRVVVQPGKVEHVAFTIAYDF
jgi:hypothetical protein